MDGKPKHNVVKMRMTPAIAQGLVRKLAEDSSNVIISDHALERMDERDIPDVDVFRVLRGGFVDEEPLQTEFDEWQCKIVLKIRGAREAGVVTIILHENRLLIKTVEWEDIS
ncbi:MAG: DUF4258 domain-containing protein [Steroidobacter sp.]